MFGVKVAVPVFRVKLPQNEELSEVKQKFCYLSVARFDYRIPPEQSQLSQRTLVFLRSQDKGNLFFRRLGKKMGFWLKN
jgi:hypothetical protein